MFVWVVVCVLGGGRVKGTTTQRPRSRVSAWRWRCVCVCVCVGGRGGAPRGRRGHILARHGKRAAPPSRRACGSQAPPPRPPGQRPRPGHLRAAPQRHLWRGRHRDGAHARAPGARRENEVHHWCGGSVGERGGSGLLVVSCVFLGGRLRGGPPPVHACSAWLTTPPPPPPPRQRQEQVGPYVCGQRRAGAPAGARRRRRARGCTLGAVRPARAALSSETHRVAPAQRPFPS